MHLVGLLGSLTSRAALSSKGLFSKLMIGRFLKILTKPSTQTTYLSGRPAVPNYKSKLSKATLRTKLPVRYSLCRNIFGQGYPQDSSSKVYHQHFWCGCLYSTFLGTLTTWTFLSKVLEGAVKYMPFQPQEFGIYICPSFHAKHIISFRYALMDLGTNYCNLRYLDNYAPMIFISLCIGISLMELG